MRRYRYLALAAFAAFMFVCCTDDSIGIFAGLAQESPTDDKASKFFTDASPKFIAQAGTSYYAATNALYRRPEGETSSSAWSKMDLPVSGIVTAGVVDGATLYVAFCDSGGNGLGVWSYTAGTWTHVDIGGDIDDKQVVSLAVANGTLFASTIVSDVYYLNVGVFTATGVTAAGGPMTGAAYDGTFYWIAAGQKLYTGAENSLVESTEIGQPAGAKLGGIASDGTIVFVSSDDGYVYSRAVGPVWTKSASLESGIGAIALTDSDDLLLVAHPETGYHELDVSAWVAGKSPNDPLTTTDSVNYQTTLFEKYITGFASFVEVGGTTRIFALAGGDGLWSNSFDGSSWSTWIRE
ncbi:MAG: hypothetical protein NT080_14750 [Spirochaetes bacterium]|nr:hypothetical protein [Spirochaetota bacterium]